MNFDEAKIKEIVDNIVLKIKSMEDEHTTSISRLINNDNIDTKTKFKIYKLVIDELKKEKLYLNFGEYENQRVGLPFNIPFKKGYVKNIVINSRIYHGKYGKGSIFKNTVEFTLAGGNAISKSYIAFCIDEKIKDKATIEISVPFSMSNTDITMLNNIIKEVESKYQPYIKKKNGNDFNSEFYMYTDVIINEIIYSIKSDDEVLSKLRMLIKSDISNNALSKVIDEMTNNFLPKTDKEDHGNEKINVNKPEGKAYSIFINKNYEELKKLIEEKKILLKEKLIGNINDLEENNSGYLFWNCKMIIRNIYECMKFLIRNYSNDLSVEELDEYKLLSETLEKIDKDKKIINMRDVKHIYDYYLNSKQYLKDLQKDRMTVKSQEVKFLTKNEVEKFLNNSNERLIQIIGSNDPFWVKVLENFIETAYEDKEKGISDLEKLAKDHSKFNEFTKEVIKRKNDLKNVKEEYFD